MNAVILAGGRGSRLAPLTDKVPKPLLPIYTRPMLDYVISQLVHFGIDDIVCTVGYKNEQVEARMREYEGIKYKIVKEDQPLGTAGAVKNCQKYLHETFVVISGDCLNDIDLGKMIEVHQKSGKDVTIAVVNVEDATKFGVVSVDENGDISAFTEKPESNDYGTLVNAGVYVINKSVIEALDEGVSDFAKNVFPILVQNRKIGAYFHDGKWTDIGALKDYYEANFALRSGEYFPFIKTSTSEWERLDSPYAKNCEVYGTVSESIVGTGATVKSGVALSRCVVMPHATVSESASDCVIGDDYCIKIENFMHP